MSRHRRVLYQQQLAREHQLSSTPLQCRRVREDDEQWFVEPGEENLFFLKHEDIKSAEEEVLFSALYRLDIGHAAARNYFYCDNVHDIGIASQKLKSFIDFKSLCEKKHRSTLSKLCILNEKGQPTGFKVVKGLAFVLMSAWLYGEDDLHRRNFGVYQDKSGEWVWGRIDFGRSLPNITNHSRPLRASSTKDSTISLKRLKSFPILAPYAPFYWPTSITSDNYHFNVRGRAKGNAYSLSDRELFLSLSDTTPLNDSESIEVRRQFQCEKYEYLLRLWLTPLSEKRKLILSTLPDKEYAERLASNVASRVIQMRWASMCDEGFRAYLSELFQTGLRAQTRTVSGSLALLLRLLEENLSDELGTSFDKSILEKRLFRLSKQLNHISNPTADSPFATTQEFSQLFRDVCIEMECLEDEKKRRDLRVGLDKRLAMSLSSLLQRGRSEEASKQLQVFLSFREAIRPIIGAMTKVSSIPLKKKLQQIALDWVMPSFQSLLINASSDVIFQHNISIRLRNIELLMSKLKKYGVNDTIILSTLDERDVSEDCDISSVDNKLRVIEKQLLTHYYQEVFSKSYQVSNVRSYDTLNDIKALYRDVVDREVPSYIDKRTERAKSLQELSAGGMVQSLSLLSQLLTQCDDLLVKLDSQNVRSQYEKFSRRTQKILCKTSRLSAEKKLLAVNVLLSRFLLDIACEHKKIIWRSGCDDMSPELGERLLEGARQLSMALAKPQYHDTLSQHDVALAGAFGTRLLLLPCIERSYQALQFSHYLSNSHQVRAKTVAALSLALLGAVALFTGISLLCPPLALASLPVALSITLTVAGGISTVGFGSFAAYRFFRDKDKVHRKLDSFANEVVNDRGSALH